MDAPAELAISFELSQLPALLVSGMPFGLVAEGLPSMKLTQWFGTNGGVGALDE